MNVEDRAGLIGGLCLRCSTHRVEFAAPSYDVPCVSWFVCHVCWFYIHLCHFPPSFHYHFTHIFAAPNPSQSPLRFPTEMAKWNAPHLAKFSRDSLKFHHFNQTWCFFEGLPKSTQIPYHFFPFPSFFYPSTPKKHTFSTKTHIGPMWWTRWWRPGPWEHPPWSSCDSWWTPGRAFPLQECHVDATDEEWW